MFYVPIHDEVSRERVPTLIMVGENDPLLGPDYARQFVLSSAPGARMVVMPCNHEIPIEMPRETAWLLEAFLSGLQFIAATNASIGPCRLNLDCAIDVGIQVDGHLHGSSIPVCWVTGQGAIADNAAVEPTSPA